MKLAVYRVELTAPISRGVWEVPGKHGLEHPEVLLFFGTLQ